MSSNIFFVYNLIFIFFVILHFHLLTKEWMGIHLVFNDYYADEVESLAAARQAALSGSEPSDSIRVFFLNSIAHQPIS